MAMGKNVPPALRASVLVVEDDEPTRTRLARVVAADKELTLAGAAAHCAAARSALAQGAPAVLLTDLGLPDGSGIDLIRETAQRYPATLSMVITVFGDEAHVVNAIEAGASGYLLKDASAREIGKAIRDLLAGGSPISPAVARYMLRRFQSPPVRESKKNKSGENPVLTERENSVLVMVAKGCRYSEIAEALTISVNTVGFHTKQIYRKLAVSSRGEAVFEATGLGLLNHPPAGSATPHH